ncbi:MAG TPA: DJ-1/PfpI family protein [Gemmatimonadales bacterium]|nr:DJ-1/PfpI family protein [Gemmatimonadales bacterium]
MTFAVGIYLFDEVEVLDFAGPFEVFSTASRVSARLYPGAPKPFRVTTVARESHLVTARAGLEVQPAHTFTDHPPIDVLIIPGGVVTAEMERKSVIDWITRCSVGSILTASVCTGAFLLAKAGLLDGKTVTTHWEDIGDLRAGFPRVTVLEEQRWIDAGDIVTSAGISAGIEMSLYLVSRLGGHELAVQTARQMEFDWTWAPHVALALAPSLQ